MKTAVARPGAESDGIAFWAIVDSDDLLPIEYAFTLNHVDVAMQPLGETAKSLDLVTFRLMAGFATIRFLRGAGTPRGYSFQEIGG